MTEQEQRVLNLVRVAFAGVTLGEGVGLRQGRGLDDYADPPTLARYRAQDEKRDWSAIPVADLRTYCDTLAFADSEGMRFHLPAFLVADLEGELEGHDVLFYLIHMEPGSGELFEKLSAAQRLAVREYLLLRLSRPEPEFVQARIERALRERWVDPNERGK